MALAYSTRHTGARTGTGHCARLAADAPPPTVEPQTLRARSRCPHRAATSRTPVVRGELGQAPHAAHARGLAERGRVRGGQDGRRSRGIARRRPDACGPMRPRVHRRVDVPRAGARWTRLAALHREEAARKQARRVLALEVTSAEASRETGRARGPRALRRDRAPAGRVVSREAFMRTCLPRREGRGGDGRIGQGDEAGGRESVSERKFAAGGDGSILKRGWRAGRREG
jgi:hypothetical protein